VSWFWAFFTPWHFHCNVVRPTSHLRSIHSLSNWNFILWHSETVLFYFQTVVISMSCIFIFYFSCLKMVNVMFTGNLLTTHLQSIVSLLNWNFMHLSFFLQLWGKAPWALSLIQCWPSLRTHAMSSSPSLSYVPHLVPEVFDTLNSPFYGQAYNRRCSVEISLWPEGKFWEFSYCGPNELFNQKRDNPCISWF